MTPQGIAVLLQNNLILLSSGEKMTPQGIAIVAGLFIFIIVAVIYSKTAGKKIIEEFLKDVEEKYPPKDKFQSANSAYGSAYVTEKGELLFLWPSGWMPAYKKWNLNEIGYIATFKGEFGICDKDEKIMRGEYLVAPKYDKPMLQGKADVNFNIGISQIDGFVAFVKKHGPHIKHTVGGKVVDD